MFIRFFACTDSNSPASAAALAYLKSLIRIAPVRIVDPARMGPMVFTGEWVRYTDLFYTPMDGDYVNVVCTEPSRWTWLQKISAPKEDKPGAELEHFSGRLELYTAGVRNALIVAGRPSTPAEVETANKYDSVICPVPELLQGWELQAWGAGIVHVPPTDHRLVRIAVTGVIPPE